MDLKDCNPTGYAEPVRTPLITQYQDGSVRVTRVTFVGGGGGGGGGDNARVPLRLKLHLLLIGGSVRRGRLSRFRRVTRRLKTLLGG